MDSTTATTPRHEPTKTSTLFNGIQKHYTFANGYGASVVSHQYSYGGDRGLWELGVLGQNGRLTYETSVTDDVLGYLDGAAVEDALDQIAALPKPEVSA